MQENNVAITAIKNALIEYAKAHSPYDGEIMDISNHLVEALKILFTLPFDVQNGLGQAMRDVLALNGIVLFSLR